MKRVRLAICLVVVCVITVANLTSADTIQGINMDFVTIGHAGNAADTRRMTDGTVGYGTVGYNYRIGKYEVTNAQWNAFTAAAGAPIGNHTSLYTDPQQPTNRVSWYETLQFCNFLTSGDKSKGVYQFSGTNANPGDFLGINRDAAKATYEKIYFLPTENEWYKAAYYKSDGSGYSRHTNGLNEIPTADNGWNYSGGSYSIPWNVGTGTQEQNGTFDMTGNVWEWNEALFSGPQRGMRGCALSSSSADFVTFGSSYRGYYYPDSEDEGIGFRVASIPEPATLLLLGLGGLFLSERKKHY